MAEADLPVATDHTHAPSNGKVELTLEQLAFMQPGVARLMLEVGNRFARGYHAAKARNGRLARFQISEGTKLLRLCAVVQPRYAEAVEEFVSDQVDPLRQLIEARAWDAIDGRFEELTKDVNRWHEEFNHGFLVWKVPATPPEDLDLTPPPELEEGSA